ncbi:hypothetical protein ADIS_4298 [Lunatimonas lonarensis]|uniref:Uncharacterized protein n=1 Tax=Lunatimonas lonarensis TaxID=1232681 RepID=R7ZM28_9BACT|nr:hypothetical protein [Lunatimonas lonarensis]EON75127.1 hypothetical protein ADIS_4298 [Lunatimonas lonarensis]
MDFSEKTIKKATPLNQPLGSIFGKLSFTARILPDAPCAGIFIFIFNAHQEL